MNPNPNPNPILDFHIPAPEALPEGVLTEG